MSATEVWVPLGINAGIPGTAAIASKLTITFGFWLKAQKSLSSYPIGQAWVPAGTLYGLQGYKKKKEATQPKATGLCTRAEVMPQNKRNKNKMDRCREGARA